MDPERSAEITFAEENAYNVYNGEIFEESHQSILATIVNGKIISLENEHQWVKESLISLITHVQRLKDEKLRMSIQLKETDAKLETANRRIEQMGETIRKIQTNQTLEVGKLEGALSHQAKIIKFIRRTVKNLRNKKALWGRMFGRSESVSEMFPSPSLPYGLVRNRPHSADGTLEFRADNFPPAFSTPRSLHHREKMKTFRPHEQDFDTTSLPLIVEEERRQMEGWVKILSENGRKWKKTYAILKDSTLYFYENDCEDCPEEFSICLLNGNAILHNAVSSMESELVLNTVKSDLPFILKLEIIPTNICQPGRLYFLMVPNLVMKQIWKRALQTITEESQTLGTLILRLDNNNYLDINCAFQYNDEILFLGSEEGLFVVNLNTQNEWSCPMRIEGPVCVLQIAVLFSLNCILMISDNYQVLYQVDLMAMDAAITSASKSLPQSASWPIEDISLCHLFDYTQSLDATYLCAATSDKICILKWYYRTNSFILQKEIKTPVPCSSILCTKKSIIVGIENFVKINLMDFTTSELFSNSARLHALTYSKNTEEEGNFPLAVHLISVAGKQEEFLLCFQKFGVFVDIEGQITRKRVMEWTGMPLTSSYRDPYLFVVHINSIVITEIPRNKNERIIKHVYIEVNTPRLIGPSPTDGSIFLTSTHKYHILISSLYGNVLKDIVKNSSRKESISEFKKEQDEETLHLLNSAYISLVHQSMDLSTSNISQASNVADNFIG